MGDAPHWQQQQTAQQAEEAPGMDRDEALAALRAGSVERHAPSRRGRWRWLWPVAASVVAVALAFTTGLYVGHAPRVVKAETRSPAPPASAATAASVQAAAAQPAQSGLSASGYVVARQRSSVSSKITGMVERVMIGEGDHVKRGQLVAVLDDSPERASLAEAKARLAVEKARVQQAQANLTQVHLAYERQSKLAAKGLTSQAKLDNARASFAGDKAALAADRAQVKVDAAALQSAQTQLSYTRIHAPFSGVVTQVYAHPGDMISPAAVGGFTKTGICKLVDMRSLEVKVDLNEDYLTRVRAGMDADVALAAYPGVRFPAQVTEVVPVVDKAQATVGVRVAFNKRDPRILPGMQAQVFFKPKSGSHDGASGRAAAQ